MKRYKKKVESRPLIDDREYGLDEVQLCGETGFARVKQGLPNARMLLVESTPGIFRRPRVHAEDGTPLRVFKECAYNPEGVCYIQQDGRWLPVNKLPKPCIGQAKKSKKLPAHIFD